MPTFPQLAFQCPMKWDEMRGDERERFCAACQRTVVNLSLMTEAERVALLAAAKPGELCVAYYQRLTGHGGPCEVPPHRAKSNSLVRLGASAAFVAAVASVAHQGARDDEFAANAQRAVGDAYASIRYQVEEWIDEARVFLGGTPRYSVTLGVVCAPPTVTALLPTPVSPEATDASVALPPPPEAEDTVPQP